MTTQYETLRDAIYTILKGITDIGNVHKQQEWSADQELFDAAYKVTINSVRMLRAWWISRVATPAETMTRNSYSRVYIFELHGFAELDASADSEQTFDTLVDDVMDTFDAARPNLSGEASVRHQEPIEMLRTSKNVSLGGYLCHNCVLELRLTVFSNQ